MYTFRGITTGLNLLTTATAVVDRLSMLRAGIDRRMLSLKVGLIAVGPILTVVVESWYADAP